MVIHGTIDGFSRLIVMLQCSSNNKASTVLQLFLEAIQLYRTPLRLRTDHGTENIEIAKYMLEKYGTESRPVITGKSVHNQRIERLWVDVFIYVIQQYRNIFYHLESEHRLDPDNDIHIFALHFVYMPRINRSLKEFTDAWNHHPLRTEKNRSPLAVWTEGFYDHTTSQPDILDLLDITETDLALYGIDFDGPTPELQTNNDVQVPDIDLNFNEITQQYMQNSFDPLQNDNDYGVSLYCQLVEYLEGQINNTDH